MQNSNPIQGESPASIARLVLIDNPIQANGNAHTMSICSAHMGASYDSRARLRNSMRRHGLPIAACRIRRSTPSFSTIRRTPVTK